MELQSKEEQYSLVTDRQQGGLVMQAKGGS